MVRILCRSDILTVISMPELIEAVEQAHADLARGMADQPDRTPAIPPHTDSVLIPMTAALPTQGVAGVKLLADIPRNPERGLPRQQSVILLLNADTGTCEAVLDGAAVTQYRTAAASAVATRHLARADSHVLGLIGAGTQARTHLAAISEIRPIDTVLVWSRRHHTARKFREDMAGRVSRIEIADTPEEVVRNADILCTLTPSRSPIVHGAWFQPGLHVNAVGAPPRPDYREIDTEGIRRARLVVDSVHTALHESGDVLIPLEEQAITADHLHDELGEVIIGHKVGRHHAEEITLFNSVGVPIQDLAAAKLVLDHAREKDIGFEVALGG